MSQEITVLLERDGYHVYSPSIRSVKGGSLFVAKSDGKKFVGVAGSAKLTDPVFATRTASGEDVNLYALTWENYKILQGMLPIAPSPCDKPASFGTGDRLGLVTTAHLEVLDKYPIFPVVAQQSPRELARTQRTFKSVLLDAVMGLLESGYTGAFGADADHIKDEQYLREGAEAGYSMYTLDVSDWLQDLCGLSAGDIAEKAGKLSPLSREIVSSCAGMVVEGTDYAMSLDELNKSALIYERSMGQIKHFDSVIKEYMKKFDLEVSIDEGSRDTTPEDHLFVTEYLHRNGIDFKSLAPKFPGEFQKGVDYMGDFATLEESMKIHASLARQLKGYRLSLHSGSDKFSVYPLFGKVTGENFHIKTSGTSWLQAVKLIASADVPMFKDLYSLCLENLDESKKAYHVYITHDHFPAEVPEGNVLEFFDMRDVRQLFHISYGVLLDNRKAQIFDTLRANEYEHYAFVGEHIDKHLKLIF